MYMGMILSQSFIAIFQKSTTFQTSCLPHYMTQFSQNGVCSERKENKLFPLRADSK